MLGVGIGGKIVNVEEEGRMEEGMEVCHSFERKVGWNSSDPLSNL